MSEKEKKEKPKVLEPQPQTDVIKQVYVYFVDSVPLTTKFGKAMLFRFYGVEGDKRDMTQPISVVATLLVNAPYQNSRKLKQFLALNNLDYTNPDNIYKVSNMVIWVKRTAKGYWNPVM